MKNDILEKSLSKMGLKDMLRKTYEYTNSGGLNTVAYISGRKLLGALENEEHERLWSKLDLIVLEDEEILRVLELATSARIREVEENKYLKEFLKFAAKEQKEIFLLADTDELLEILEGELQSLQSALCITGRASLEDYPENKEALINIINLTAPRIILSRLTPPADISMMNEYGSYLNPSLWMALPEAIIERKKTGLLDKINKFIYKKLLNRKINHSKDTEKK